MPKDRYHEVCTLRESQHLARIEKLEAALQRVIELDRGMNVFSRIAREALKN
jgi:hypothetical protein